MSKNNKCEECNGNGFIELFVSSVECRACSGTGGCKTFKELYTEEMVEFCSEEETIKINHSDFRVDVDVEFDVCSEWKSFCGEIPISTARRVYTTTPCNGYSVSKESLEQTVGLFSKAWLDYNEDMYAKEE